MIAKNENYVEAQSNAKKQKVMVLVPYYEHGSTKGILDGLNRDDYLVFSYLFNERETESYGGELEREYKSFHSEPYEQFKISPENVRFHMADLTQIVQKEDIDLIIPTKEKYISLLAENREKFQGKVFLQSEEIIKLLQDKSKSYDFLQKYGVPVPKFVRFNAKNTCTLESMLQDQACFVKPSCESGGKRAYRVDSIDEFKKLFSEDSEGLIACELLNLPEFNHTVIVKDGQIKTHATYECPGSTVMQNRKLKIHNDKRINKIAERTILALNSRFGNQNTNGVYNIDFLTNNDGEYVLSEVNVGRLPDGHRIFTKLGLNLSNFLANTALNPTEMVCA